MPTRDRRAAGRRRAWGRGPIILRFEPLEGRQLLAVALGGQGVGLGSSNLGFGDSSNLGFGNNPADTTTTPTSQGLPDLIATRTTTPTNLDWDEGFVVGGVITNQGKGTTTAPFLVDVYASPEARLVPGAVKLGTVEVPAGLEPGNSFHFEQTFRTPPTSLNNLNGKPSYYITLAVDTANAVTESNETNNANLGLQGQDAAMVTITPRLPSKLAAAGLTVTPDGTEWGGTIHVKGTVRNDGAGDAPPTNARIILAPLGQDPFGPTGYTVGSIPVGGVQANQSLTAEQDIVLPREPPTSLANVSAFSVTMVVDGGEEANPVVSPMAWKGKGIDWAPLQLKARPAATKAEDLPDLKVLSVENPAWVAWGQTFTVKTKVENHGKQDAGPFTVRFYLVQGDTPTSPTLALGDATVSSLKVDSTQEIIQTIRLPARVPDGLVAQAPMGRIVVQANFDHALDEASLDDNTVSSATLGLKVVGTDGSSTPVVITPADDKLTQQPPSGQTPPPPNPQGQNQGGTQNPGTPDEGLTPRARRRQMMLARLELLRQLRLSRQQARQHNLPSHPQLRIYPNSQQAAQTPRPILQLIAARQQSGGPNRIA